MYQPPRLLIRCLVTCISALTISLTAGCAVPAWVAHGVAGGERTYQVKAQYLGLDGRTVAVMVAADEYTLFQSPSAPLKVSRAVSARIAANVSGASVVPPKDVIAFQHENPYWGAVPYGELIEKLGVERLVVVDLIEYRTHEPGNAHVWQGMIAGEVGVVEAESDDPDNFAFSTTVRGQFPEESSIGVLDSDRETIELGMLTIFSRDAGGLFYDHEVVK